MTSQRRQRGATLLMAMVFLVFMSLFAVSAFKGSVGELRIIGNTQARQESLAVAQKAIEQTLTSGLFISDPTAVAATPVTVDIDGSGSIDYTAVFDPPPRCYRIKAIKMTELDIGSAADRKCMWSSLSVSEGLDLANVAAGAGRSMCANREWNLGAKVDDPRTGTSVLVNQGIAIRILATTSTSLCL